MKDLVRKVILTNSISCHWNYTEKMSFTISVEDEMLLIQVGTGQDVFMEDIEAAFGMFLWEYQKEYGETVKVSRPYAPYRYFYRLGPERARDVFLEIDFDSNGLPAVKHILHTSSGASRCFGVYCYVYDFLNMLAVEGVLMDSAGEYEYPLRVEGDPGKPRAEDHIAFEAPRELFTKDGWVEGSGKPAGIVEYVDPRAKLSREQTARNADSSAVTTSMSDETAKTANTATDDAKDGETERKFCGDCVDCEKSIHEGVNFASEETDSCGAYRLPH